EIALRAAGPRRQLGERGRPGEPEERVDDVGHALIVVARGRGELAGGAAPQVALAIQPAAVERALDLAGELELAQRERQRRRQADLLAGVAEARDLAADALADRVGRHRLGERGEHAGGD